MIQKPKSKPTFTSKRKVQGPEKAERNGADNRAKEYIY